MTCASIILAAGQGTRLKSSLPKVLHPVGGLPLVKHVIKTVQNLYSKIGLNENNIKVVISPTTQTISESIYPIKTAVQIEALGTGHATLSALSSSDEYNEFETVFILFGDTPLIKEETLLKMMDKQSKDKADIVVLGFEPENTAEYGRLVVKDKDVVSKIVEFNEASSKEREITICNSGVFAVRGKYLHKLLLAVKNENSKQEYYLTDIVEIAKSEKLVTKYVLADEEELLGVNTRADLAKAEKSFQDKKRKEIMEKGVTLIDPHTVYFNHDTEIECDVIIEPFVVFGPNVTVQSGVTIHSYSHIEGAFIKTGAKVGPFVRLRSGSNIGEKAKIGNFVEVKNTIFGDEAKASHLSYLGDSVVGARSNIGAGTITCNYDGFNKSQTHIGRDVFIGSNSALVAPVAVGEGAIVGAGSVVTKDVETFSLAIARPKQVSYKGWARKFRKKKQEIKK